MPSKQSALQREQLKLGLNCSPWRAGVRGAATGLQSTTIKHSWLQSSCGCFKITAKKFERHRAALTPRVKSLPSRPSAASHIQLHLSPWLDFDRIDGMSSWWIVMTFLLSNACTSLQIIANDQVPCWAGVFVTVNGRSQPVASIASIASWSHWWNAIVINCDRIWSDLTAIALFNLQTISLS